MPWRDQSGQIAGTFGISKDITGLKESEAKLIEVHRQLVEASRHAGMAEVATGVLHNVGNVLNSVNVSASMVYDRLRASRIGSITKVANLLEEHAADLADFIVRDARGQKLPQFLAELGRQLQVEQAHILEEIEFLRRNVDHIKEIVAMQQAFAKITGVVETISVTDLIEDSVRVQSLTLERSHIELVRQIEPGLEITIDRHKVIQILVNLISNAKYACDATSRPDKRIVVKTARVGGAVQVVVQDNGVGIAPENLTRIFGHGFTTRKDGHGFGLHSGALAARELGGSLTVDSEGVGLGAKFILELPLTPVEAPAAPAEPAAV
jgi:signal transduction histidine kinase